jgi:WASH complex subunit strumpellin
LTRVLQEKPARWAEYKRECVERMQELSEVFGGTKPLSRVQPNKGLEEWFARVARRIDSIDFADTLSAGRSIAQVKSALDEAQVFHQLELIQARQYIDDTKMYLVQMLRVLNIRDQVWLCTR